jgi:hypothetical protein
MVKEPSYRSASKSFVLTEDDVQYFVNSNEWTARSHPGAPRSPVWYHVVPLRHPRMNLVPRSTMQYPTVPCSTCRTLLVPRSTMLLGFAHTSPFGSLP